jgi:uncharacterized membrane protein
VRAGALLIGLGLLVGPWSLAPLATEDGTIHNLRIYGAILLVSALLGLTGLQLLSGWVDRLSWTGRASNTQRVAAIALFAAAIAAVSAGLAAYKRGHSHTTLVSAEHEHVTTEQEEWAEKFYERSLAAALEHGWFDINNAFAQGFQADPINRTHFPNQQYMFDDVLLDPERPEWLVYDDTPHGKVLMALMFFTRTLEEVGPTPAGRLAQWHYHEYEEVRCAVKGLWTVAKADADGRCAEGVPVTRTPEMFHVWFMDHPLGHFTEMKIVPEAFQEEGFDVRRLHPIAVHFAIALFVIAVLIDLAAAGTRRLHYHQVAWINLVLAALAAAAAVATGMTAEVWLSPTHETHQTLDVHRWLGYGTLATVVVLAIWRYLLRGEFPRRAAAALYVVLSLAGLGMVGATGYYGGELVYSHGAAVQAIDRFARERYWEQVRRIYRPQPAAGISRPEHH